MRLIQPFFFVRCLCGLHHKYMACKVTWHECCTNWFMSVKHRQTELYVIVFHHGFEVNFICVNLSSTVT